MKDRSRAVAMMVLHMSSHIVSGRGGEVSNMSRHFISHSTCFFLPIEDFFFSFLEPSPSTTFLSQKHFSV